MTRTPEQAAAEAIFDAYENRHALSDAEQAMRPADLAAMKALAAASLAAASQEADDGWEWMLVEVLGHRRHTGRVREEERFGAKLLRIDVPLKGDPDTQGWQTHYYAPASLYGLTPCTRETAMRANKPYEPAARLALSRRDDGTQDGGIPF